MNEVQFINDKDLRDKNVNRYEVLEKVKELLLLPELECMTTKQVSDYYEVGKEAIEAIYTRNSDELLSDGMRMYKKIELLNLQHESLETFRGKSTMRLINGSFLDIPNRGLKLFTRRAILRVGMLLRDSLIAKEVRAQLLNIEGNTTTEIKTQDISEEHDLMLSVGMAYASGDPTAIMVATTKMMNFKNRHILKLEQDNRCLAGEILDWKDRSKLNAGIRKLAAVTGIPFGNMWNELYKNLQYKYSIGLKQRGDKPYLKWVKENEWIYVLQTFSAMCKAYEQSPSDMFQQITPKHALASK